MNLEKREPGVHFSTLSKTFRSRGKILHVQFTSLETGFMILFVDQGLKTLAD